MTSHKNINDISTNTELLIRHDNINKYQKILMSFLSDNIKSITYYVTNNIKHAEFTSSDIIVKLIENVAIRRTTMVTAYETIHSRLINEMRVDIPNFSFVFGFIEYPKFITHNIKEVEMFKYRLSLPPLMIIEHIDGPYLGCKCNNEPTSIPKLPECTEKRAILFILQQMLSVYMLWQKTGLVNYDYSTSDLKVRKLDNEVPITYKYKDKNILIVTDEIIMHHHYHSYTKSDTVYMHTVYEILDMIKTHSHSYALINFINNLYTKIYSELSTFESVLDIILENVIVKPYYKETLEKVMPNIPELDCEIFKQVKPFVTYTQNIDYRLQVNIDTVLYMLREYDIQPSQILKDIILQLADEVNKDDSSLLIDWLREYHL